MFSVLKKISGSAALGGGRSADIVITTGQRGGSVGPFLDSRLAGVIPFEDRDGGYVSLVAAPLCARKIARQR